MADPNNDVKSFISVDIGDDGMAAEHPVTLDFRRKVAPSSPEDKTHNTLKDFLIVVGCASFFDALFAFDSSFILPEARQAFIRIAALRDRLAEAPGQPDPDTPQGPKPLNFPPISLFGHADPVGKDDYNSQLSQRRARSVYAVLIRDVATWKELKATWKPDTNKKMIETVDAAEATTDASKLSQDKLIAKYMDFLCVRSDGKGGFTPYKLSKTDDFLARGKGQNGKGDLQGCGEFNPTLLLSKAKLDAFEKAKDTEGRNKANEINRRVILFFFKPGSQVDPKKWPCPNVRDLNAPAVCKDRFWSDGAERRTPDQRPFPDPADPNAAENTPVDREFKKTKDTFACRFYHGLAENSPCEGVKRRWEFRVLFEPPRTETDKNGKKVEPKPVADRRFVVTLGDADDAPKVRGRTDENGVIRLPVFEEVTNMDFRLEIAKVGELDKAPAADDGKKKTQEELEKEEENFRRLTLLAGQLENIDSEEKPIRDRAVIQRLFNLGYGPNRFSTWKKADADLALKHFQRHHKIGAQDGKLDPDTRAKIKQVHDSLTFPRDPEPGQAS